MKPRYVDFLSDQEYKSLTSYKADTRMLFTGAACVLVMVASMMLLMLMQ
jgi:hypothetical protein